MRLDENKAIARRFYDEVWNRGYFTAADEIFAPDMIRLAVGDDDTAQGPEEYKRFIALNRAAFPDMQTTIEELLAEGDRVVGRWVFRATHTGASSASSPRPARP